MEMEITKRVGAGWKNGKKSIGVYLPCVIRMPAILIGMVFKTVIGGEINEGFNEAPRKPD